MTAVTGAQAVFANFNFRMIDFSITSVSWILLETTVRGSHLMDPSGGLGQPPQGD